MRDFILTNFSVDAAKLNWQVHACALLGLGGHRVLHSLEHQPAAIQPERAPVLECHRHLRFRCWAIFVYLPKAWYNAATGALSFWKKPKKNKKFYGY